MLFQLDASNRLFAGLIADADYIKENFISYLQSFSDNVKDIIQRFDFFKEIDNMI